MTHPERLVNLLSDVAAELAQHADTDETRLRAWAARLAPAAVGTPGAAMAWAVTEIDRLRRRPPFAEPLPSGDTHQENQLAYNQPGGSGVSDAPQRPSEGQTGRSRRNGGAT